MSEKVIVTNGDLQVSNNNVYYSTGNPNYKYVITLRIMQPTPDAKQMIM